MMVGKLFVLASAFGVLLPSCSPTVIGPSATVTTLTPGADQWFRLSWEPVPENNGKRVRLRGYVENRYGEAVGRVQLLAQAFDVNDNVVDQKIVFVTGAVPAFDRVYYEIASMPPANRYGVSVWAYERRKFF
jgi:hypothetical protein